MREIAIVKLTNLIYRYYGDVPVLKTDEVFREWALSRTYLIWAVPDGAVVRDWIGN